MINIWQTLQSDESLQLLMFLSNSQNCELFPHRQMQPLYNYRQLRIIKWSFLLSNFDLKHQSL